MTAEKKTVKRAAPARRASAKTTQSLLPEIPRFAARRRRFARLLLAWYDANGRDLPWRRTRDPYAVLVSEVMLQQTPVVRVLPKYDAWLTRFPTPAALAKAPRAAVEKAWRPLGYNARAWRLHDIARSVVADGGAMPSTLDGLLALDGIGEYTARAVLTFAYEKRTPVMDTNVARVLARVFGVGPVTGGLPVGREGRLMWEMADAVLPRRRYYDYTQALMDLGATLCLKRNARCESCPIRPMCHAFAERLEPTQRAHDNIATAKRKAAKRAAPAVSSRAASRPAPPVRSRSAATRRSPR